MIATASTYRHNILFHPFPQPQLQPHPPSHFPIPSIPTQPHSQRRTISHPYQPFHKPLTKHPQLTAAIAEIQQASSSPLSQTSHQLPHPHLHPSPPSSLDSFPYLSLIAPPSKPPPTTSVYLPHSCSSEQGKAGFSGSGVVVEREDVVLSALTWEEEWMDAVSDGETVGGGDG